MNIFPHSLKRGFALAFVFCLPLFLFACDDASKGGSQERPVPVRLGRAEQRDVPRVLEAVGNVEAHSSVQVKSQVYGQIVEVPVAAGQEVEKDQVLFRLDPRPFDAAVAEAEARLARNMVLRAKAEQDLARYSSLLKQDVISREAFDEVATTAKTVNADIDQDKATLQTARLNREYSVVRAPVAGKLGDILVRLGNVMKENDDRTLVVINSLRPAEVHFTVAERFLPSILHRVKEGPVSVTVLPEGDSGEPITGAVTAVNNEVDRTTGSIRLQALFSNDDNRLWPGQFVRVSLVMATIKNAVLVPDRAIQEGISGQYVYVAAPLDTGGENRYRVSPVSVTTENGPAGFVVIVSGLASGDTIVTDGQLGLSPGALAMDMGKRPAE